MIRTTAEMVRTATEVVRTVAERVRTVTKSSRTAAELIRTTAEMVRTVTEVTRTAAEMVRTATEPLRGTRGGILHGRAGCSAAVRLRFGGLLGRFFAPADGLRRVRFLFGRRFRPDWRAAGIVSATANHGGMAGWRFWLGIRTALSAWNPC